MENVFFSNDLGIKGAFGGAIDSKTILGNKTFLF